MSPFDQEYPDLKQDVAGRGQNSLKRVTKIERNISFLPTLNLLLQPPAQGHPNI